MSEQQDSPGDTDTLVDVSDVGRFFWRAAQNTWIEVSATRALLLDKIHEQVRHVSPGESADERLATGGRASAAPPRSAGDSAYWPAP